MQGFSWVSNDLAVTTFLLELECRDITVQYIWLNRLQVVTSSGVTTCLKQYLPICVTVWYSVSVWYRNCSVRSVHILGCECYYKEGVSRCAPKQGRCSRDSWNVLIKRLLRVAVRGAETRLKVIGGVCVCVLVCVSSSKPKTMGTYESSTESV